jgi:DNA-binding transcriptional regulator YhcF (GntR family)
MMQKNKRFGIINYEVISDPSLSLNSKVVYSVLAVHCNKNRTCFPSIGTVANMLNVSYSTVWRSMNELKKSNCIERKGKIIKLIK